MKSHNNLALVLSGGGARAAYQVGFLLCLAKQFPNLNIPILTGVSSGAINATFLANHRGSFAEAVAELADMWLNLNTDQIFRTNPLSLMKFVTLNGVSFISGGHGSSVRGLVDTSPLQNLLTRKMVPTGDKLTGICENLRQGRLKALAITGTNYGTGQSMTWVQGKNIEMWERPHRRSALVEMSIAHVMASASLPLFFPAIQVGSTWFGDGGIRQSAPLSPALHLGARKILGISTRYQRSIEEADTPGIDGYPPAAQILSTMMNAIFLDTLDEDARWLETINSLIKKIPVGTEGKQSPVDLCMLRPSVDIGKLCAGLEERLPGLLRYLVRGLGTHQTQSPDWLSMVMFDPGYIAQLLAIGEADAVSRMDEVSKLIE